MLLKLIVSLFSIIILFKNFSYAKYEYHINKNSLGATFVSIFSFFSVCALNLVLFFYQILRI